MNAKSTIRAGIAATPMPVCSPYRRKATQKAPRKRSALLLFSKQRAGSVALSATGGNDGPRGPADNTYCRHWWGDEPSNNHHGAVSILPGGMAFVLASLAVTGALQAGPAFAEATSHLDEGMALLAGELEAAADTAVFNTLPASYSPTAFTEDEKELVCPKQYRVRETIYVGH